VSPRNSAAAAAGTRTAILDRAVEVASTQGLEGLTIGRLAADVRMSKAGVIGHFGTKERLQLAAVEAALDIYRREVWEPAAGAKPGLRRLRAVCDAWISYFEREVFPGGCFLAAASCEFDDREGPVRDVVAGATRRWLKTLAREVRTAVEQGELPADTDPAQVAFELNAIAMGANQQIRLLDDRGGLERARRAMGRALDG
jgi:AcrR family transcriptional regulator